jgi:hypothetical protein
MSISSKQGSGCSCASRPCKRQCIRHGLLAIALSGTVPDSRAPGWAQTLFFVSASLAIRFTSAGREAHRAAHSRKTLTPFVGVAGRVEHRTNLATIAAANPSFDLFPLES